MNNEQFPPSENIKSMHNEQTPSNTEGDYTGYEWKAEGDHMIIKMKLTPEQRKVMEELMKPIEEKVKEFNANPNNRENTSYAMKGGNITLGKE
jgi:hypothetical protein